jgi:hypothetical protein
MHQPCFESRRSTFTGHFWKAFEISLEVGELDQIQVVVLCLMGAFTLPTLIIIIITTLMIDVCKTGFVPLSSWSGSVKWLLKKDENDTIFFI